MTARQISLLAFRLFAVYLLVTTLASLPTIYNEIFTTSIKYGDGEYLTHILSVILSIILPFLIAYLLWDRADRFTDRVLGYVPLQEELSEDYSAENQDESTSDINHENEDVDDRTAKLSHRDIHSLAFIILGVWTLITAIPNILYYVVECVSDLNKHVPVRSTSWAGIAASIIRLLIGYWLVLNSPDTHEFIRRLRNAGRRTLQE